MKVEYQQMTVRRRSLPSGRRITCTLLLAAWLLLDVSRAQEELYLPQCRRALGMQSGEIPDSAITGSSSYDEKSVGPLNSRVRTERNGGAWCPKKQIAKDVYEWLEIDLGGLKVITVVETQGRFGNGQGQEYAPHYLLEYQREEHGRWIRFRNRESKEIFQGNSNTYLAEMREIRPPIIASRIRFIPYSVHPRTICMRVEMHGCEWTDDIRSYQMRQGDRRGAEVDLYDFTYDGSVEDGFLQGGLGQLTDWEEGNTNFRLDLQGLGKKGYEWVGWKNETMDAQPVEIVYEFGNVRNFTELKIHSNNLFSKGVRVFRAARLYFSIGGTHFNGAPLQYEYLRDSLIEFARVVTIPIPHRVGKFVKLVLYFDSRWIMVSETRFESEPAMEEFPIEEGPDLLTLSPDADPPPIVPGGDLDEEDTGEFEDGENKILQLNVVPDDRLSHPSKSGKESESAELTPSPDNMESAEPQPTPHMDNTYIAIIIGTLSALILLLLLVVVGVIIKNKKNKYSSSPLKSVFAADHVNFNLNDLTPGLSSTKLSNGNMYNPISTTESNESSDMDKDNSNASKESFNKSKDNCLKAKEGSYKNLNGSLSMVNNLELPENIQCRKLPDLPESPKSTDTCRSNCTYATPDLAKYPPLVVSLPPQPVFQSPPGNSCRREETPPPPHPPPPNPRDMYAAADMVNIQGLSGNSVYAVPNPDLLWGESLSVVELPRDSLKLVEKLGQGQFGEVHLCEAVQLADFLGEEYPEGGSTLGRGRSVMVAVKMLRPKASEQARADFHKEVKIMSQLRDPNIVRVLGVCTAEEPLAVVVEYMKHGDLNQFLIHRLPEGTLNGSNPHTLTLSYGCLIYMATQIASGMKYLENLNMVHRDLATRNCLVGSLYTIKISDFGMSRSLYSNDYYRIEGRAVLPIRWMAWESVLLGKFSCKSDVWSFAVALWEILTFARDQPFSNLNDEQVIENCGHYYRNDTQEEVLPPPGNCPKEIFDLMRECWNRDETLRPSFREIHMFLQRKNMGYDPRDELERPPSFGS